MARKVKCPICNTLNNKEEAIQIGNRYYCKRCGEEKQQSIKANTDGWDQLFDYICELYDLVRPTGLMFKQLKEFREDPYNYTNAGMYLTLKYYYETLGNKVKEGTGLGIIPYYYEKAKQHYIDILKIEEYMDNFQYTEEVKKIRIRIQPSIIKIKSRNQLSFNNISWEEDTNE